MAYTLFVEAETLYGYPVVGCITLYYKVVHVDFATFDDRGLYRCHSRLYLPCRCKFATLPEVRFCDFFDTRKTPCFEHRTPLSIKSFGPVSNL